MKIFAMSNSNKQSISKILAIRKENARNSIENEQKGINRHFMEEEKCLISI